LLVQQKLYFAYNYFNRSWAEYKVGFNDSRGNYWLGNDLLSQLTLTNRYKLKTELQSRNTSHWYYAEYSTFIVEPESDNYRLHVSGYSGNAGFDALSAHNQHLFSTTDRHNDRFASDNCAAKSGGGFWYFNCCWACLNGYYGSFAWMNLPGGQPLQSSRMWLQCK